MFRSLRQLAVVDHISQSFTYGSSTTPFSLTPPVIELQLQTDFQLLMTFLIRTPRVTKRMLLLESIIIDVVTVHPCRDRKDFHVAM